MSETVRMDLSDIEKVASYLVWLVTHHKWDIICLKLILRGVSMIWDMPMVGM